MMKDIVPLKKNLGRKKYNRFVDSFLKKSLLLKLIRSPAEFSKEQAEELSRLIEHDKFKIDEKYHANVSDGLSIELTATFQNGYTMRSFGKFLRANSHKLEKGSAVEDFLKANYFTGAPAGFHYERLNPDEAFRCTEFLDAAVDKEGMQAIPSKEGLEKTMGEYCTITPNEKITKLLKHDKYSDYFKETFFDAKTKYKKDEQARTEDTWKAKEGFEDLVEKFSALGAEVDKQPQSIVHNDMHRKNLVKLVSAPSSPKIIDWDESIIGAIQKDLWRVNMSVYEHNCANAKDARDASIRKLYEAIQESQKRTDTPRSQYTDSLEEFTRKYLIIDALENLNFTAKAAEFVKKKEGKPEFDFFSNLRDLVYTRALDTLNELGETQLEQRMTEFGKQNGLNRWDRETRTSYEKSVHPDLMVGAVRANEELSDEAQNEQAFLFNKAANKRIWKKRRNMSVIAASLLAALSYCAYKFIPPAIDTYKAKTAISRTIKKDIAEENSLISAPLFIESAVYKARKLWPEVLTIDKAIKETIDNDREGAEEYVEDTNRKLKEIDHYLSPDCKDELFIPRSRFRKLLSEQTTPEEKKAIAKEFLTRNKNKSYAETLLEDLYEDLKPGMFTQKAAGAYSFHIKFISRQDGLELSTEQDWKKFFTEYFSKETAQRLEKAFADYNNSPAVKNETRLSLPKGSLDALVFAGMIEENLMYKLREYTESNGVKPELLKNDKYLVGMLANYLAQNIDKHKDIAKAFAACLYGDRKVEDAATMTASNNFFEYKYNLPKEGRAAELTWLYFMQKTENVKEPERMLLSFLTNQYTRDIYREALQVDALGDDMNKIISRIGKISKNFDDSLEDKK